MSAQILPTKGYPHQPHSQRLSLQNSERAEDKQPRSLSDPKRRKDARHPNLGQAPPKKVRNPKPGASTTTDIKPETRTYYICNKPGHIAPNCLDKAANKRKSSGQAFQEQELHGPMAGNCERYELKTDYIAMDQVCTWSHYQVDILLYEQYIYIMCIVTR